jgi:hypothetical protein
MLPLDFVESLACLLFMDLTLRGLGLLDSTVEDVI